MAEYDAQIEMLESDSGEDFAQVFVIKGSCPFNDLPEFHIVDQQPPDISHDIFEGVGPLVLSWLLTVLIKKYKVITIQSLNDILLKFPYHARLHRNHPQPVSWRNVGVSVKATAAECRTLIVLLPLMIGMMVPDDRGEWLAFFEIHMIV